MPRRMDPGQARRERRESGGGTVAAGCFSVAGLRVRWRDCQAEVRLPGSEVTAAWSGFDVLGHRHRSILQMGCDRPEAYVGFRDSTEAAMEPGLGEEVWTWPTQGPPGPRRTVALHSSVVRWTQRQELPKGTNWMFPLDSC